MWDVDEVEGRKRERRGRVRYREMVDIIVLTRVY